MVLKCWWIQVLLLLVFIYCQVIKATIIVEDISWNDDDTEGNFLKKSCQRYIEVIQALVYVGELSKARYKALQFVQNYRECKKDIIKVYVDTFESTLMEKDEKYLQQIKQSSAKERNFAKKDTATNCTTNATSHEWTKLDPNQLWDESCSLVFSTNGTHDDAITQEQFDLSLLSSQQSYCCEFAPGSWTYLRLPALHEPAVRIRIPRQTQQQEDIILDLEQDGYLRLFDVAGIVWPTGYLLSLCLGNIMTCPIPELHTLVKELNQESFLKSNDGGYILDQSPIALELGAGVGAPSIALAKYLQGTNISFVPTKPLVVATDLKPYSLALTITNAKYNKAKVEAKYMDFFNITSVREILTKYFSEEAGTNLLSQHKHKHKTRNGFALVYGTSLQNLFQNTTQRDSTLWKLLDELLDKSNPNALAILIHTRTEPIGLPALPSAFRLVRKVSGSDDAFGNMHTRSGDTSDFMIFVFQREMQERHSPEVSTWDNEL